MNGYFNSIIEIALSVWAFLIKPKPSEPVVELPALSSSSEADKRPQTSPQGAVIIEHDFRTTSNASLSTLFLPDLEPPAEKLGMDTSEYTALAA